LYPNIVGYIDGTALFVCRPTYDQQLFYSGYKKHHVVKYQSVIWPNGLIARLDGPYYGRRHDAAIVHLSGILKEMEQIFVNPDGTWMAVYGDSGYSNQKFIKSGYRNFKRLTNKQKEFNATMSSLRVSVELGFGKVLQQFAFLDFAKDQKIFLQPLKKYYYVAVLLANCQTCLRGRNQVSDIFDCHPPSLEEYLG
jgi:nuclease HARBI1